MDANCFFTSRAEANYRECKGMTDIYFISLVPWDSPAQSCDKNLINAAKVMFSVRRKILKSALQYPISLEYLTFCIAFRCIMTICVRLLRLVISDHILECFFGKRIDEIAFFWPQVAPSPLQRAEGQPKG